MAGKITPSRKGKNQKAARKSTSNKPKSVVPFKDQILDGPRSARNQQKENMKGLSVSVITVRKVVITNGRFHRVGSGENGSSRAVRFLSDGVADLSTVEDIREEIEGFFR